jgi:hypothetical protein
MLLKDIATESGESRARPKLTDSSARRLKPEEFSLPVRVFKALSHLEQVYPGFGEWYWAKVVPGLRDGSRCIFVQQSNQINGIVIAKRSNDERKLCTVWVNRRLIGRGLGTTLMRRAMSWLGTTRPLITVPEERLAEFQPSFRRWEFSLDDVVDSLYRPGCLEYVYNGRLIPSPMSNGCANRVGEG